MSIPQKRPAYEPAEKLLIPPRYDPRMKRPATTAAGALLVLLRVTAGVLQVTEVAAMWATTPGAAKLTLGGVNASPDLQRAGLAGFVTVAGAILLVDAAFAVLIYLGYNRPRVIVMVFAVFSISGSFAGWWANGLEITLRTSFVSVALDILILLALSSRSAAAYARRRQGA